LISRVVAWEATIKDISLLSLKTYELYIPEYEQLYKNLFDNFDSKISEQEKKEIIDNMKLKKNVS